MKTGYIGEWMSKNNAKEIVIRRLPTRQDAYLVFSACVFPLHFWITLVFLYNLNSLLLKATFSQLLGVFSYLFFVTLLECCLIFAVIVVLSFILPGRLFRDRFSYSGTSFAFIFILFAFIINTHLLSEKTWLVSLLVLESIAYLVYITTRPIDLVRTSRVAERLTVIATLYIILDIFCIVYIIIRQII